MAHYDFAISGQHYLFDVQSFAQTILSQGGDAYHYALRDRTTAQLIDDVVSGISELGVVVETSQTANDLETTFTQAGLKFHELAVSAPRVAVPLSHPLVNAKSLSLEQLSDYPYIYFEQGENDPAAFAEEALGSLPREKSIATTDRATLTELIMAVNGYTVTSGILVGITDGSALTTIPLETDVKLHLGYVARIDTSLSEMASRFVSHLQKSLDYYAE